MEDDMNDSRWTVDAIARTQAHFGLVEAWKDFLHHLALCLCEESR